LNWRWYCFVYLLLTLFASQCDRLLVSGCGTHFITLHLAAAPKAEKQTWQEMWGNIKKY